MRVAGGFAYGVGACVAAAIAVGPLPAAAHPGHDHGGTTPVVSGGCYVVRSAATGGYLARARGKNYAAQATAPRAEPFRVQATGLDRYMLLDRNRDVLSAGPVGGLVAAKARGRWRLGTQIGGRHVLHHGSPGRGRRGHGRPAWRRGEPRQDPVRAGALAFRRRAWRSGVQRRPRSARRPRASRPGARSPTARSPASWTPISMAWPSSSLAAACTAASRSTGWE